MLRLTLRSALVPALALALSACALLPNSSARLADSAYELNSAAHFGRMDLAMESVHPTAKDDFAQAHATWGKGTRVMDSELSGVSMRKDGDADVMVSVTWHRANESTMRTTDLVQRWTMNRGVWSLKHEEEKNGDRGLLAEVIKPKLEGEVGPTAPVDPGAAAAAAAPPPPPPVVVPPGPSAADRARYQTKVIYDHEQ